MPFPLRQMNYQSPSDWFPLKGNVKPPIPEHYFLYLDKNNDIKIDIVSDKNIKSSHISKDVMENKNKYQTYYIHHIKRTIKNLLNNNSNS
ncbi:hypothetical protein ID851_18780 [Xenorhabdus sp. 5]|nr:hypothetical protein [Xenorhabdus sp. M]MBD2800881.1 hypothetical protein [Xenorhabdus sp. M]MBD2826925.1 hypothetical protein [Xenorhabdus sp. 5]